MLKCVSNISGIWGALSIRGLEFLSSSEKFYLLSVSLSRFFYPPLNHPSFVICTWSPLSFSPKIVVFSYLSFWDLNQWLRRLKKKKSILFLNSFTEFLIWKPYLFLESFLSCWISIFYVCLLHFGLLVVFSSGSSVSEGGVWLFCLSLCCGWAGGGSSFSTGGSN